jgi:hypothetical protein
VMWYMLSFFFSIIYTDGLEFLLSKIEVFSPVAVAFCSPRLVHKNFEMGESVPFGDVDPIQ